jgi:hypothetical protein
MHASSTHPFIHYHSIIWWSVCNEIGCTQLTGDATIAVGVKYKNLLAGLDRRPMTGAWKGFYNTQIPQGNSTVDEMWARQVVGVYGKNYGYGGFYDDFHNANPTVPILASEHCSCTSDRAAFANATTGILDSFHSWGCIQNCWQPVATREFMEGLFDWTGFDYRSVSRQSIRRPVSQWFSQ